jgi:hypothetical protein
VNTNVVIAPSAVGISRANRQNRPVGCSLPLGAKLD